MEIICVPAIVSVIYVLIEIYKKWIAKGREKWLNFIPLIATVLGAAFGVLLYYLAPQMIIASNVWVAVVIGLCSGLSATGANQIFKQLEKFGVTVKEAKKDE
jgi:hypothetical protein